LPVTIGSQLGSHEITGLLGKGGMGEVYRARDTKLKREVAIKILPDEFSRDPDRVTRFQREAEVLASLNHPNIAGIYDLAEANGSRFLVLELVEGETLAERIKRRPIPIDEALNIAKSICEALEAAHEKGVIHRDLKPANVKITPDGKVKVLDFGLAKAMESTAESATLSNSPTMVNSMAATNAGIIIGTAAYMSPEQARGRKADPRSDVFSLGCVLYEILTGKKTFRGEDVSDVLASVLARDPDLTLLPPNVDPRIHELLRRCLDKDPKRRWQAIGDVRIEIENVVANPLMAQLTGSDSVRPNKRSWLAWAVAAATLGVALTVILIRDFNRAVPSEPPEIRVEVNTPPTTDPFSFAVSPDGRRLVFLASSEGKSQLWVRPLDSLAAQPLAGTEGAAYPFWSPDSLSLGFYADRKLKRVDVVGGAPQVLAIVGAGSGGTWNPEGVIVFAPTAAGPLLRLPAIGGEPVAVTRLEAGQSVHRFPQFLPDGRHFIYLAVGGPDQGLYVHSLDETSSIRLTNTDAAAVVAPAGFLLFPRQTNLFAQAFDFKKQELFGTPFPVAEEMAFNQAISAPGVSTGWGLVAYRRVAAGGTRQLVWLDRSGKPLGPVGAPATTALTEVALSPDEKRVAVVKTVNGPPDIWLVDTSRGVPTRFTFDAAADGVPLWSLDGNRLVFTSNRTGVFNMYGKSSSGAGAEELLLKSDQNKMPNDWSPDGRFLLFRSNDLQTGWDLWVLPMSGANASPTGRRDQGPSGDKIPFPYLKTPFEERDGQFSPDGKWIAYQSNESGQAEIYIQPFPGQGGKFQISTNGGAQVRWNKNGRELFYVSLDSKMMAVPVRFSLDGQSLETASPVSLFSVRIAGGALPGGSRQQYAVSSDGQRFLVNLAVDEGATSPITIIYNWKPKPTK
jgi:eukaryotic-like serine/threonine-protein kinase